MALYGTKKFAKTKLARPQAAVILSEAKACPERSRRDLIAVATAVLVRFS